MTKVIRDMLPADARVARDVQDLLGACCALGFADFVAEVQAAYEQHKVEALDSPKASGKWSRPATSMTEEEAIAAQQRMFAACSPRRARA
eukprot:SM000171S03260  [mRNA]  locus=s171:309406:310273:- [translate_table: standard]